MDVIGRTLKLASLITATSVVALGFPANAQNKSDSASVSAGRVLAINNCSECHVVVPRRFMPQRSGGAPDFVDIANETGTTAMALLVFLHTPHASMPNLVLTNDQSNDVIA